RWPAVRARDPRRRARIRGDARGVRARHPRRHVAVGLAVRGARVTARGAFVSGAGKRLTAARLVAILAIAAVATAVIAVVAPMIGWAPEHGSWHLELLGRDIFTPG